MSRKRKSLVERFRARGYVDLDDTSGRAFEVPWEELQARLRADLGDEGYTTFHLALAVSMRHLTTDEALRLASSDEAAALFAAELERERARDEGRLVRFRRKR